MRQLTSACGQLKAGDFLKKLLAGSAWLTFGIAISQLLNLLCVVLASFYLAPPEYGRYATAVLLVAFSSNVSRFGLLDALVRHPPSGDPEHSTALLLSLCITLGATICVPVLCLVVGIFSVTQDLLQLVAMLSLSSAAFGLQSLPEAILRRDGQFREVAVIRVAATATSAFAMVGLLLMSYGIYALVVQRVVYELTVLAMMLLATRFAVGWGWSKNYARRLIKHSAPLGVASLLDLSAGQTDQILVRIAWGESALGVYALAKRLLANFQQIAFLSIRQVAVAKFASLADQGGALGVPFINGTAFGSLGGAVAGLSLAAAAPSIFALLFPPEWTAAGALLGLLALVVVYDGYVLMYPALLQASNEPHWLMIERLLLLVIGCFSLLIVYGAGMPLTAAPLCVLLQSVLSAPALIWAGKRIIGRGVWMTLADFIVILVCVTSVFALFTWALNWQGFSKFPLLYLVSLSLPAAISVVIGVLWIRGDLRKEISVRLGL